MISNACCRQKIGSGSTCAAYLPFCQSCCCALSVPIPSPVDEDQPRKLWQLVPTPLPPGTITCPLVLAMATNTPALAQLLTHLSCQVGFLLEDLGEMSLLYSRRFCTRCAKTGTSCALSGFLVSPPPGKQWCSWTLETTGAEPTS